MGGCEWDEYEMTLLTLERLASLVFRLLSPFARWDDLRVSASRLSVDRRAQSEMIGTILILGLTVTGSTLVVAFGSSALTNAEQRSEIGSVEHAMTQLDSRTSLVGLGGSPVQTVQLGNDGDSIVTVDETRGWMRIRVINATDGSIDDEVMNQSLGVVEYRNGDTTVAYQGGGVWRSTPGGTTMVSPPEFHYRERTLTLPLVSVGGTDVSSGRLEISKNGSADPKFPLLINPDRTNPLTKGKVNVTVQSTYYRAWGAFFEERTGGNVALDEANQSVTLTLVTPSDRPPVSSALASTSAQEMEIKGSGGSSFTDSYNSSKGDYDASNSKNGSIITSGGVELSGGAEIRGNLISGSGTVRMGAGNTRITGNLSYGGSTDLHKKATVDGWIANNGSAPTIDHVDGLIDEKIKTINSSNDNAGQSEDITGGNVLDASSPWELPAGHYYLSDMILSGGTLVLNNTGGDVVLAVDGDISLDSTKVVVKDPSGGSVEIYMDGTSLDLNDANVSVPDDLSTKLWVYGPPETSASFTSHSRFVGVVYAPDTQNRRGEMVVDSQTEVYGALVGGKTTLQSGGTVHFDQALESVENPVPGNAQAPKLTYLHVSVNRVNVTSV